jgi:membrane protease YdiL (CAAX protease family)
MTVLVLSAALWIPLILVSPFVHPTSALARCCLDTLTAYGPAVPGFYFLQREYRPAVSQFGMTWRQVKTSRVWCWTVAAILPVGLLWLTLSATNLRPAHTALVGDYLFPNHLRSGHPALAAAVLLLVVPAIEELFFRGYLYLLLSQNWGWTIAAIVSSGAFAALHGWHAPLMFLWSLLDVYLNNRAGSLCPSLAAHATWNAGFLLSG